LNIDVLKGSVCESREEKRILDRESSEMRLGLEKVLRRRRRRV